MSFKKSLINTTTTENGDLTYISTNNNIVDLYYKLVRGISKTKVENILTDYLLYADNQNKYDDYAESVIELFSLLIHTRDIRGGKGEKNIFYWMVEIMNRLQDRFRSARHCIATLIAEPSLVTEFGSFRDINMLYLHLSDSTDTRLIDSLITYYVMNLRNDTTSIKDLSFAWKYAPRENHNTLKRLNRRLVRRLGMTKKEYRIAKSVVGSRLSIVEQKMCGKRFTEINFQGVPSKAMNNYRKAFSNSKGSPEYDRIEAAKKFVEYLENVNKGVANINSSTLYPHELVDKYISSLGWYNTNMGVPDDLIEEQWKALVNGLRESNITGASCVSMVDVSGSMNGNPMNVAIALGIALSELLDNPLDKTEGPFANMFISFDTIPQVINLRRGASLCEKVHTAIRSKWGMSTNFDAALRLILDKCIENKLSASEVPKKMFVFSDMQFDVAQKGASNKWTSRYARIKDEFYMAGMNAIGEPYDVPTIIYWNLRGDTNTVPDTFNTEGVVMLSGFSAKMLKHVFDDTINTLTPLGIVREIIFSERYDYVRDSVRNVINN